MEGRGCFLCFRHRLETNNVPQCEHMAASKKKSKHSVNTPVLGDFLYFLLHSTVNENRQFPYCQLKHKASWAGRKEKNANWHSNKSMLRIMSSKGDLSVVKYVCNEDRLMQETTRDRQTGEQQEKQTLWWSIQSGYFPNKQPCLTLVTVTLNMKNFLCKWKCVFL